MLLTYKIPVFLKQFICNIVNNLYLTLLTLRSLNLLRKEYFPSAFKGRGISSPDSSEFHRRRITQIVSDANRPKGQSIFHGKLP